MQSLNIKIHCLITKKRYLCFLGFFLIIDIASSMADVKNMFSFGLISTVARGKKTKTKQVGLDKHQPSSDEEMTP